MNTKNTFTFHNRLPTSIDDQEELREALLKCAVISDRSKRKTIIDQVVEETEMPRPEEHDDPGFHTQAIIVRCNGCFPEGITALLKAISSFGSSKDVIIAGNTFGKIYCHLFSEPQDGITNDHLSDLKAILDEVTFDIEDVRTAFDRSGENQITRPPTNPKHEEREFRALLWTAATAKKLNSGRMPLVSFVQELAELASARSAELRQWCKEVGRQLKIDTTKPQLVRSTQPDKDPCLQIIVQVDEKDEYVDDLADATPITVTAQLWLNDTETDWRHFALQPTTLVDLPNVVFRIIADENCQQCLGDLTIEVFLPYGLLKRYAVEEWSVNLENGVKKYFRKHNSLVLRASDRFYDPWSLAACKKRWQHLQGLQQTLLSSPSSLVWVCNTDMSQIEQYYEPTIVGAALLIKPDEIPDFVDDEGNSIELLQHFITQGLPMLMWTRQELPDDVEHYRTIIHNSAPHRVPDTILKQRQKDTKRWRHVALLWDNPNRIPHYFKERAEGPPKAQ